MMNVKNCYETLVSLLHISLKRFWVPGRYGMPKTCLDVILLLFQQYLFKLIRIYINIQKF